MTAAPRYARSAASSTGLDLLAEPAAGDEFDAATERAVRAFQQSRGLSVDGRVGAETWRALDAARWRLGARTLYHAVPEPLIGDDVRALQERLLEMGYDVGPRRRHLRRPHRPARWPSSSARSG